MKTNLALLPLLLTLLCTCVHAQSILTGTVIDAKTEEPLPYVYLKVNNAPLGTVTEANGSYRLTVPDKYAGQEVVFSYLGYQDQRILVSQLKGSKVPIRLKPEATTLVEITVTPKKLPSARAILRRALKSVDKNYPQGFSQLDGYYRETLKENGVFIKYADAAVSYRSDAYTGKNYKWKDYANVNNWGTTLGSNIFFAGASLHRVHFHHQTLKTDQLKVIDSRGSENGTRRAMKANITGGPLSLFSRDRVKFQESFLGKKRMKDFDYLVDEVQDENGKWLYSLEFRTTSSVKGLLSIPEKKNKRWRTANKHKLLEGKILIDPDDYGILAYECHIPNELKPLFCGYTTMAIKHFDYKLNVRYKKVDGIYVLDYMRHEDEFIFKDTTDQTTTPYAAISEFTNLNTKLQAGPAFAGPETFANVNTNELYEYALAYDSMFWVNYQVEHPEALIAEDIRTDMETKKPLEQQFRDKQARDDALPAPVAPIDPVITNIHGEQMVDDYAWLKDTKRPNANQPVMDYLRAENDYIDNYFLPIRKLQRQVFKELSLQVEKDYVSLPTKDNGYYYHYEYEEDKEHPVYFRSPVNNPTQKDTLVDANAEADKYDGFYSFSGMVISPDNNIMAYGENTTGSDKVVIRFRKLKENVLLEDSLTNLTGLVWIDNETMLYTAQEPKTLRANKIMRHKLGTPQADDEVLFNEKDPLFGVGVSRSKSKEFLFISSGSTDASELWYLRTDNPYGQFRLFVSREDGNRYGVSHDKDKFYISSNKNAMNGQLMVTDTSQVEAKHWKVLIPHRKEVMIQGLTVFDNYFVVTEKENAQPRLRVIDRRTDESHYIKIDDEFYQIGTGYNPDTNTDTLQFSYSSFKTPSRVMSYHMETRESRLVRKQKHVGGFGKYIVKREWATAEDGTKVPITLVYDKWRNGGPKSDHKRLYLTSYGSYGSPSEPGFSEFVNKLVQRGFTYAIAHVRGGNDLGMQWYFDGRMLKKKNTFTDFIACAEHLIAEGYTEKGSITAQGGSAGGLLMGAIANERPDLFRAIILDVPFVDVVNTMLDDKLPLTTGEYLEWGDPNKKKYFKYMKSYSPYDNVKAQDYPHMFFFTGLNDTRVGYWEPAKMVAKLRAMKTNDNLLLLKTNLNAGHGGASGRYASLKESAYKLALLFDLYAVEESRK